MSTNPGITPEPNADFIAGVVEGFYGPPWTQTERIELFDWMASWELNTYLYAPKDDLKHRVLWRQPYSTAEAVQMAELVQACKARGLRFVHALSPGLDIRFSKASELACLQTRFDQMLSLGVEHFALLFDDIPDQMQAEDWRRWGSFALAQCHVANAMFHWTRERSPHTRFLFCPTPYCERMAQRQLGGAGYLQTLGIELSPQIDVLWTGPDIISRDIPVAHAQALQGLLRRKPLIWDNLHANDYDLRRFYCGPYAGRPLELRGEVAGILANPNVEFPLNYVPLRTLATYVRCAGSWDARHAYLSAMAEWHDCFATVRPPATFEDLVLLGDCYYLPYEEGPQANELFELARSLLASNPEDWGERAVVFRQQATRLRDVCARVTELQRRPLFHALGRRLWELREELDLLLGYVRSKEERPGASCHSDFHLPGAYRGGMVARLQRLLTQNPDGAFVPNVGPPAAHSPSSSAPIL